MLHAIEFTGGMLIVLAVFADVFGSVLLPRASRHHLRIGPAIGRLFAPAWRYAANASRSARVRQNVRGSLAPALMMLSLAIWTLGLSLGFALMLHAQPQNVSLDHFGFGEAFFQSAMAISTLGVIDAHIDGTARVVVAVAGISGFFILTLVVAFVLAIQAALHRRELPVLMLAARAGHPPSALSLLASYAHAPDDEIAGFFAQWERWTAEMMQSHLSYPVLLRFRSLDEDMEWITCLGVVLDAAALFLAARPDGYPRSIRAAGFLAATADRAVAELARLLAIPPAPPLRDQGALVDFAAVLDTQGFTAVAPDGIADRLAALRASHMRRLPRIADRLDLAWTDTLFGERDL